VEAYRRDFSQAERHQRQVPISKRENLHLIRALRVQKVQNKELFSYLIKGLVSLLNTRQLNCSALVQVASDLHILKMRSKQVFRFIITYFIQQGYTHKDLALLGTEEATRFLIAVAVGDSSSNDKYFFNEIEDYISQEIE